MKAQWLNGGGVTSEEVGRLMAGRITVFMTRKGTRPDVSVIQKFLPHMLPSYADFLSISAECTDHLLMILRSFLRFFVKECLISTDVQ